MRTRGILDLPRVHFLGAKPYAELPRYARFYDVAILPFAVNEITESVSPVKIFEYMAAGKPVVTTGLPECRKYRSCLIADTPDDFVKQLHGRSNCAGTPYLPRDAPGRGRIQRLD